MTVAMKNKLVPGVRVSVSYFPGQKGTIDSFVASPDSGSYFVRMANGLLEEVAGDDIRILGGQSYVEKSQSTKVDIKPGDKAMYGDQEVTVKSVADNKVDITPADSMETFSVRPEDLVLSSKRQGQQALSDIIDAWDQYASGVQVDIMNLPDIFLEISADHDTGMSLEDAVQKAVAKHRVASRRQSDLSEDMGEHLEGKGDPKADDLDEFMDKKVQHEESGETGEVDEMLEDHLEEGTGKPQEEMKDFYEEHNLVEGSLQRRSLAALDLKEGDRVSHPEKGEGIVTKVGAPFGGFKGVAVQWDNPIDALMGSDPSMTPGKLTKINYISPRDPKDVQAYITTYARAFTQDQGYDGLIANLVRAGFVESVARDVMSKEWPYLPENREMAQTLDGLEQFTDPLLGAAVAAMDAKNSMECPKCAMTGHEGTCPLCGSSMKRREMGPSVESIKREALKIKDSWGPDGSTGREIHMEQGDGGIEFSNTDTGYMVKPMHDPGIEERIDEGGVGQSEETQMQTDMAGQEIDQQQDGAMMDEEVMPQVGDSVAVKGVNKTGGRILAIKDGNAEIRFADGAHAWFNRKIVGHHVEAAGNFQVGDRVQHMSSTAYAIVTSMDPFEVRWEQMTMFDEPPPMEAFVKSSQQPSDPGPSPVREDLRLGARRTASATASPLKVVSADELSTIMASDDFKSVSDDYADPKKLQADFSSLVNRCQNNGISLREAVAQSRLMGINPKFICAAVPSLKEQAVGVGLKVDDLIG